MFHLEAIRLIWRKKLRGAVQNTPEGREVALGRYIAGMGFSNVGLGIVHGVADGLSALYPPTVWPAPSCARGSGV